MLSCGVDVYLYLPCVVQAILERLRKGAGGRGKSLRECLAILERLTSLIAWLLRAGWPLPNSASGVCLAYLFVSSDIRGGTSHILFFLFLLQQTVLDARDVGMAVRYVGVVSSFQRSLAVPRCYWSVLFSLTTPSLSPNRFYLLPSLTSTFMSTGWSSVACLRIWVSLPRSHLSASPI